MAELKIKADSGGGTVSLKGPSTTTSNAAVQLTLPVDDGTSGQYLKTDGSGALSWATVASSPVTALNNATANELVTVGSTTTELDAEADFTFDGTKLELTKSSADPLVIIKNTSGSENEGACLKLWASARGAGVDDEDVLLISNNSNARNFGVSNAGTVNTTGNIVMASGKGIDFSATANGATDMSSELLDDYEEGEFDAVMKNGVTLHGTVENMQYTKIGRQVTITGEFRVDSDNSNSDLYIDNLPFASTAATDSGSMAASACVTHDHNFTHGAAVFAYIMEGSNDIRFVELQDNGGYANADADSGAYYCLSITYFTSS